MLHFRGGDVGICVLGGICADHDASSGLFEDCIIPLHASARETLCELYVLVVPVKPVGCCTYKENNYALATFGQVSPGLPGTTLMRCPDKLNSLKNKGSFLHFLPMSLQLSIGNPILSLCPVWNWVLSDPKRRMWKKENARGNKHQEKNFFTYNSFWQEMFSSFRQKNFVTIFKMLISL